MMKSYSALAITALLAIANSTQAEVYDWQDDLCEVQGEFDNEKYNIQQIQNSHIVLAGLTRSNLDSFFPPMTINALDKLSMRDLETLTEEYKYNKSQVEQLDVLPQAQPYKQQLLKSIAGEYKQNKLTILAYLDPVQAMRQSPPMCKQYLAPFFKNQTAVQTKWREFVEEQIQEQTLLSDDGGEYYHNLATERYQREKADDPANYAKINLLTFGFGNCVNDQVYHADSQIVFDNYNQLNKTIFGDSLTMVCEDP